MSEELRVERLIDAPPEIVFDAFVDPDTQAELHGSKQQGWNVYGCEGEIRVGGTTVATMGAEGGDRGTETRVYSVVERPSRLVFRYSVQGMGWPQLVETEMTITFEDQGGKTLVAMVQTGFERAEDRDRLLYGWPVYLDILQTIVASKGAV